MEEKKEVQETIIKQPLEEQKATEEEIMSILKIIAPGTNLRTALDNILKAEKGALIAIENENLYKVTEGGFKINARFTPQKLFELSKMDGALVLSKDIKKILYANVLLSPDSKIKSLETGTRHKAAERTAKQSGSLVIAISERKKEITLYYKNFHYPLANTNELLRKSNENIQLLEKQRELFDKHIERLNILELRNHSSLNQAVIAAQKGRLVQKIAEDLRKQIIELGKEGTLLKTRLKEILQDVEKETNLIIKDYTHLDLKKSKLLIESLSYDELLEKENILKSLAYEQPIKTTPIKGWRILSKTTLQDQEIAELIKSFSSLNNIVYAKPESLSIDKEKADILKDEIERIKIAAKL